MIYKFVIFGITIIIVSFIIFFTLLKLKSKHKKNIFIMKKLEELRNKIKELEIKCFSNSLVLPKKC